eukprot:COSAG02_NODE_2198_length_9544_cov_30.739121_4_plen_254_part_00
MGRPLLALPLALALMASTASATTCDLFQAAATPCVAAHSTVRALYKSYSGPLYQVRSPSPPLPLPPWLPRPGFLCESGTDGSLRSAALRCAVPGQAQGQRQDTRHQGSRARRVRRCGGAGQVLRRKHLRLLPGLRPEPDGQPPRRRARWRRPPPGGHPGGRCGGPAHGGRPQGLRAPHGPSQRLPPRQHNRHRGPRRAGDDLCCLQRLALQQPLLLRLCARDVRLPAALPLVCTPAVTSNTLGACSRACRWER